MIINPFYELKIRPNKDGKKNDKKQNRNHHNTKCSNTFVIFTNRLSHNQGERERGSRYEYVDDEEEHKTGVNFFQTCHIILLKKRKRRRKKTNDEMHQSLPTP